MVNFCRNQKTEPSGSSHSFIKPSGRRPLPPKTISGTPTIRLHFVKSHPKYIVFLAKAQSYAILKVTGSCVTSCQEP